MKLSYIQVKENKTMLDCLEQAKKHIENCLKIKSIGVKDLVNQQCINNRIIEYAKTYYIQANYYKQSKIVCELRALHHSKPIGSYLISPVGEGELNRDIVAKMLKDLRLLFNFFYVWGVE